ncbi:serine protease [Aliidongia dinghuensis]|uniref:Probable periplasmic serine endoprotease DegP-like n=1 Tax=Aliidongia dinghuensis TaxID=1867774 RepID=A0A8J3E7C3_9PROT|nr:DegQ family serine endoprotease [Aliidongia dinghuensis]GGF38071.1 serine protease [Aliidongia dinghuensis]
MTVREPTPRRRPFGRTLFLLGLSTSLAFGPLAPAFAQAPISAPMSQDLPSFSPIVDKVLPAVVNISVIQKPGSGGGDEQADQGDDENDEDQGPQLQGPGQGTPFDEFLRRFFEQQQQGRHGVPHVTPNAQKVISLGSGFIVDPTGYVVTNNHVVGDAEKVTVTFADDSQHPAKIIGKDQKSDLALLKIDAPKPLPYVKLGDSDQAKVGDWVIAVGNPFGLGGTVTKGIVSARGRPIADSNYVDFLQIDASINRGNSGGPTFNMQGEVIGINTAIFSPNGGSVGIGFAIPSNSAKNVIEALKKSGHVDRGWLGVQIQEVTPEIANSLGLDQNHPTGALVSSVSDNSPASKAGVKVGDVIEKFNGKTVEKMRDLPRVVAETPIGTKVDLGVFRKGEHQTLSTTIEKLDDSKVASIDPQTGEERPGRAPSLGLTLSTLNPDIRKRLSIPKDVNGVLVSRVKDGSPAADKGIEAGDVIVQIDQTPVSKPEEVIQKVKDASKDGKAKSVLLLVNRRGQNRYVALTPEDKAG